LFASCLHLVLWQEDWRLSQWAARECTPVASSIPSSASMSSGREGGGEAGGGTGKLTFVAGNDGQLTRLVFVADGGLCSCGLV
jgi:hypothetical protein